MTKEIIKASIKEIYNALNTISPKGYQDSKTYTNCMEALNVVLQQIDQLEVKEKENTVG